MTIQVDEYIPSVQDMAYLASVEKEKIRQEQLPRELKRIGEKISLAAGQGKREVSHKIATEPERLVKELRKAGYIASWYACSKGQFLEIRW